MLPPAFRTTFALIAVGFSLIAARAETCLSPFVKRLDRPEKYLYVYCVDADAKDHDFLAVVDVLKGSPTYGKLLHQLDLGTAGNETHHFGFTDDRTHIWGLSCPLRRASCERVYLGNSSGMVYFGFPCPKVFIKTNIHQQQCH